MIEAFDRSPAVRRAAALAILALVAWIAAPVFLAPLDAWRANEAMIVEESTVADRFASVNARRAAVAALAAKPDTPLLIAAEPAIAMAGLQGRLMTAAPAGAMRLDSVVPLPAEEGAAAAVRLAFGFTATQGGFNAFLADIETRTPLVALDALSATTTTGADGSILLTGTGTLSVVPLMRAVP